MARLLAVDPQRPAPAVLAEALAVLRRGGVMAYPTDTVYGLAVDAMRPDAIARLYALKGRPESKALPVIIGALSQLAAVVATVPAIAERLMAAFWPGPLTLLMLPQTRVPAALLTMNVVPSGNTCATPVRHHPSGPGSMGAIGCVCSPSRRRKCPLYGGG